MHENSRELYINHSSKSANQQSLRRSNSLHYTDLTNKRKIAKRKYKAEETKRKWNEAVLFHRYSFLLGWTVRFLSVGQRLWPNPEPDGPTVTSSFKHGRGEANTSDLIATVVGFYQRSYGVSHPKREKLLTCCSITVLRTAVVMFPGRFPVGIPYQKRSGRRERTLSSVATRDAVALTGFRPGNRGRCLLSSPCRLSSDPGHDIHDPAGNCGIALNINFVTGVSHLVRWRNYQIYLKITFVAIGFAGNWFVALGGVDEAGNGGKLRYIGIFLQAFRISFVGEIIKYIWR